MDSLVTPKMTHGRRSQLNCKPPPRPTEKEVGQAADSNQTTSGEPFIYVFLIMQNRHDVFTFLHCLISNMGLGLINSYSIRETRQPSSVSVQGTYVATKWSVKINKRIHYGS